MSDPLKERAGIDLAPVEAIPVRFVKRDEPAKCGALRQRSILVCGSRTQQSVTERGDCRKAQDQKIVDAGLTPERETIDRRKQRRQCGKQRLKGAKNNLQPVEGRPRPNGALENEAHRKETSMDAALAFAALLAFFLGAFYLKQKKLEQKRELLHRERMLAMEKGIPLPEFPEAAEAQDQLILARIAQSTSGFFRNFPLGLGLVLLFGGAGVVTAFMISTQAELHDFWTLGLIPVFLGAGLILYYLLTRESRK